MSAVRFGLIWGFVFLAAGFDSYFAWHYRAVLPAWEQNPLVCWAVQHFGLATVFAFKFVTLAFAAGLALHCRSRGYRVEYLLTIVIGCAYGLLAAHYAMSYPQPTDYVLAYRF